MASPQQVDIHITYDALAVIQESKLNLCLARGVQTGGEPQAGNVVFASVPSSEIGPNVIVNWNNKYAVALTNTFENGAQAISYTDIVPIVGGDEVTFENLGRPHITAAPQGTAPSFIVGNEDTNPAAVAVYNEAPGSTNFTPIFVSPPIFKGMQSELLPINIYSIFWDGNLTTGTMFDQYSGAGTTINLTYTQEVNLEYDLINGWTQAKK